MRAADLPWRRAKDHLVLRVRLTPRASRETVEGLTDTAEGPAIAIRVRATPEAGAANAALEALLADWLDVPKRSVTVVTGTKSRVKGVAIAGDPGALAARIAAELATPIRVDR
jgi:uncharacterized protein YggU (UPF0235/DUF167 family)